MPFEVYLLWNQYPWVLGEATCDAKMLATEMVTYSSIFTIVAFTIERWVCLCMCVFAWSACLAQVSQTVGGGGEIILSDVPSCLP